MEQAGYDFEDGHHLLGVDSLNILLKFVYKSQLLAGVSDSDDYYDLLIDSSSLCLGGKNCS